MNKQPLHARLAKLGAKNTHQIALEKAGLAEPHEIKLASIKELERLIDKARKKGMDGAALYKDFINIQDDYTLARKKADEAKKAFEQAAAEADKAEERYDVIEVEWESTIQEAYELRKQANKVADQIEKGLKELGVNINTVPALKEVARLDTEF